MDRCSARCSVPARCCGAWAQTEGDAPLFLTARSCVVQDKVLKELDEAIDAETLKLRNLRYKMVDAGVYKSWCVPPTTAPRF